MSALRFAIEFHGPFRVGVGAGRDRIDAVLDENDPIPGSELKGLFLHASRRLAVPPWLIAEVFGDGEQRRAGDWSWSSAQFATDDLVLSERVRIAIDPDTGSVLERGLQIGEEAFIDGASFEVERSALEAIDPQRLALHIAAINIAAHGIRSLGASRNRGLGWVSVRRADHGSDERTVFAESLRAVREARP